MESCTAQCRRRNRALEREENSAPRSTTRSLIISLIASQSSGANARRGAAATRARSIRVRVDRRHRRQILPPLPAQSQPLSQTHPTAVDRRIPFRHARVRRALVESSPSPRISSPAADDGRQVQRLRILRCELVGDDDQAIAARPRREGSCSFTQGVSLVGPSSNETEEEKNRLGRLSVGRADLFFALPSPRA